MLIHLEPEGEAQLYSYDVESKKLVPLGIQGSQATISPDRKQFTFQQGGAPYLADWTAPTTSHRLLPEDTCATSDRPAWSPDGTELAVVCQPRGSDHAQLLIVGTDGGEIDRLDVEGISGGSTWVDEDTIVYVAGAPGGDTDLWQFNLDSRERHAHHDWNQVRRPSELVGGPASHLVPTQADRGIPHRRRDDHDPSRYPDQLTIEHLRLDVGRGTTCPTARRGVRPVEAGEPDVVTERHRDRIPWHRRPGRPAPLRAGDGRRHSRGDDRQTPGGPIQEPGPAAWDSR